MIAALGVAWWPWSAKLIEAHWDAPSPQPGAPARLDVRAPGLADAARGTVVVVLRTPRETLRWSAGEVRLRGGRATLELTLSYPYSGRVPGLYRYEAEVRVGGLSGRTDAPLHYRVGASSWFA